MRIFFLSTDKCLECLPSQFTYFCETICKTRDSFINWTCGNLSHIFFSATYNSDLYIKFNATKSCLLKICKNPSENIQSLKLGLCDVLWCDRSNYLRMHIVSDKYFKLDTSSTVRKLYAAANAIYSHTKYIQELPRLSLFESFTLPLLTYGFDGLLISWCHWLI